MSTLVDQLKRAEYQYYEDTIDVIALIDRSGDKAIRFEGIHLILVKDSRLSMPLWIAEILEDKGMVKIPLDDTGLLEELDGIQTREAGSKLSKIDKNLYRRVRKELELLRKSNHRTNKMKHRSIDEYYHQILEIRSKKIVAMFSYQNNLANLQLRDLPVEEKWLLDQFTQVYLIWKNQIGENIKLEVMTSKTQDNQDMYRESRVQFKPRLFEVELKEGLTLEFELNNSKETERLIINYEDERIPIPSYFEYDEKSEVPIQPPLKTTLVPGWVANFLKTRNYGDIPAFEAVDSSSISIDHPSLRLLSNAYELSNSSDNTFELINFFAMESSIKDEDTKIQEGKLIVKKVDTIIDNLSFKIRVPKSEITRETIPLWIAELLEENELIVIPEKISESTPRNFTAELNEYTQGKGSQVFSSNYYRWVRKEIEELRSYTNDAELIKLNRLESYLDAVLRRKARGIVSKFPFDQENIKSSYTGESSWLVQKYVEIVEEWKEMVLTDQNK